MRWMSSRMPSTSRATSFLYCSSFGFGGAAGAVVVAWPDPVEGCCPGAAVSETVTAAIAARIQKRDRCMNPPGASVVSLKFVGIRPALHPGWLRCSSLKYARYSHSSRLAIRAHHRPRCTTNFRDATLEAGRARLARLQGLPSDEHSP